MAKRAFNFYAGPATLPTKVLERAQESMLDYNGTGMSVMELSHRSKDYDAIHMDAIALVREHMGLGDDYKVLYVGGGASSQFYMIPTNLKNGGPLEYVNTGVWSTKAIKEGKLFGDVNVVASSEENKFKHIPKDIQFSDNAAYAHITGNNTIYGTEFFDWPKPPSNVPLVCDMSSHLMDRKIDFKQFGVIYAGAQKNLGPAGVTMIVVREDLVERVDQEKTPTMMKWKTHADKDSLFNTPPAWPIYICKLALEYMKEIGGIEEVERRNREKANMLYNAIDASDGYYVGHAEKDSRSLMNVTFNLPTPELEAKCIAEGVAKGLVGIKGYRTVGGMRASIYNAMPVEGVRALVEHMAEFKDNNPV